MRKISGPSPWQPTSNPYCHGQSGRGVTVRVTLGHRSAGSNGAHYWPAIIGSPDSWATVGANPGDVVPNSHVPSPIFLSLPVLGGGMLDQSSTNAWPCICRTCPTTQACRPTIAYTITNLAFPNPTVSEPIDAACRPRNAKKCRRTDHGPLLSSIWVSILPSRAFCTCLSLPLARMPCPLRSHLPPSTPTLLTKPQGCRRRLSAVFSFIGRPRGPLRPLIRVAAWAPKRPLPFSCVTSFQLSLSPLVANACSTSPA